MKTIVIDGVIGKGEGEISSSMVLQQLPTDGSPIHVKIHSEGGDVFEGFRIHDVFANYSGAKKITIESSAFSIASFIPMAFDEIEITPNGYLMIHNPYVEVEGDDEELTRRAKQLSQFKSNMIEAYAKRTGLPAQEIAELCKQETFLNAEQCVSMGFANRITAKPVAGRVFAHTKNLPYGVVAALFGADSSGNTQSQQKGKTKMSDSTKVAATVKQIKAAYPKAKETFIVRCMEKEMPMEEVATAMTEELEKENETLSAKVAAMEQELNALRAKAQEEEQAARAKAEEDEEAKAKAQSGVRPVAKSMPTSSVSAATRWKSLVGAKIQAGLNRERAIFEVEKEEPSLRQSMLAEANS